MGWHWQLVNARSKDGHRRCVDQHHTALKVIVDRHSGDACPPSRWITLWTSGVCRAQVLVTPRFGFQCLIFRHVRPDVWVRSPIPTSKWLTFPCGTLAWRSCCKWLLPERDVAGVADGPCPTKLMAVRQTNRPWSGPAGRRAVAPGAPARIMLRRTRTRVACLCTTGSWVCDGGRAALPPTVTPPRPAPDSARHSA
jgi:hypothetical protein